MYFLHVTEIFTLHLLTNSVYVYIGLGDAWGAAPPPTHPREGCIKELGSHLLQVSQHIIYEYICFLNTYICHKTRNSPLIPSIT